MSKFVLLVYAALLVQIAATPDQRVAKYRRVEAYEVQPGVLMMPRYTADGQICEAGIERRYYSPELIRLDPGLSREKIYRIFEELVPERERGKKFGREDLSRAGHSITTTVQFENVSLQIVSDELPSSKQGEIIERDIVGIIRWNARKCS